MRINHKMTLQTFSECHYVPFKKESDSWVKSTEDNAIYCINHYLLPEFGSIPLAQLDPHALQLFFAVMAEKHSTGFAYHLLWLLGNMLRLAKEMGIIAKDPTLKVEVPDIPTRPTPIASRDQIVMVLRLLPHLGDRCMFALLAFCRVKKMSELLNVCWGAYQGGYLRLSPSVRPLLLPECIQAYIADWRALCPNVSTESLMFPNKQGKAFSECTVFLAGRIFPAARRAGIPDSLMGYLALQRAAAVRSFPRHGDAPTALSMYLRGKDNAAVSLDPDPRKSAAAAAPPAGEEKNISA